MKARAQIALTGTAILFGAGALYAFADEEDHTPPQGSGECGEMNNFTHLTEGKLRHGGSGATTPAYYKLEETVPNRARSEESGIQYKWVQDWSFHDEC